MSQGLLNEQKEAQVHKWVGLGPYGRKKRKAKEAWPNPLYEGLPGNLEKRNGLDQATLELPEPERGSSGNAGRN